MQKLGMLLLDSKNNNSNPLQLHICINLVSKRSIMQTTPQPFSICWKYENMKFLFNCWETMSNYKVECVRDLFLKIKTHV